MKLSVSILIFLIAACSAQKNEETSDKSLFSEGCKKFPCTGRYEECEVIGDSPLCIKKCPECKVYDKSSPVCGSDGNTYDTLCRLQQAECMENIVIEPLCNGKCPCDPKAVEAMDPVTVQKLQKLRLQIHLDRRFQEEMEAETAAEKTVKSSEVLDQNQAQVQYPESRQEMEKLHAKKMSKWLKKKFENSMEKFQRKQKILSQETKKKLEKNACTRDELMELPARLIDWFHVLKSNEIRSEHEKRTMKEMTFLDAKLKAMYIQLACKKDPNRPDSEVFCLQPVQWMFSHLDGNNNGILEASELTDLEDINSEHCMRKFFMECDRNRNGTVERTEFCRCLCIEPPCTKAIENIPTVLIDGVPRPVTGPFIPKCNEDGFYMSKQCNDKECFCVDRNGLEVAETRRDRGKDLQCADNTNPKERKG